MKQPTTAHIWDWLNEVYDPEIPVISVVDLGIVRDVRWQDEQLVVTITPTYSGCPASSVIEHDIEQALRERGIDNLVLKTKLAPPWTTDWLSETGRKQLRDYGIAPPMDGRHAKPECPRCGSSATVRVSEFGSTPCKAHYKCRDCLEPFDYFKCLR